MEYIAHIRESDQQSQTVKEHLLGVLKLAESFGEKIGAKYLCGLGGLLHDIGKYSSAFQEYLIEAVSNPEAPPKRGSVDHSTAGGRLLYQFFHKKNADPYKAIVAEIIGNAIISHHSYLQDFLSPDLESSYLKRVHEKELPEFPTVIETFFSEVMSQEEFNEYIDLAATELKHFLAKEAVGNWGRQLMFLTKFIFSALIDADRTNTRLFEENSNEKLIDNRDELFRLYYERLMKKLNSFKNHEKANSPINLLRSEMSEQCDRFAEKPSGIFTLSIPTGGGKTLASLRYALKHAKIFHKKQILFIVPYTTIIEQNANEVRKILKDEANILEHHSNVIEDWNEDDEYNSGMMNFQKKLKLAKDNWDSPIIFTTMVQFLNVFYASGSRNIRRLHNLSDAVIIFDEVQKVPISCVSLFNQALNFLKNYASSSIVLCTATQPALDFVENKLEIGTDAEIVQNLPRVIESFKRVEIIDRATTEMFDNERLSAFIKEKIDEVQSVLVILNTKSVVKNLFNLLVMKEMGVPIYHLSTSMCPAHRITILEEIRDHLINRNKIICISTQLIEAGVDVSFDCVIRSLAGLDSIAQAAGRCNRHGDKKREYVYVIDHSEENLTKLKEISEGKNIARKILVDMGREKSSHGGDILSKQAMDRYFQEYYTAFESNLNYSIPKLKREMTELLTAVKNSSSYYQAYMQNKGKQLPLFLVNSYKTAAEYFQVIESNTTSVLVPFGEGKEIIADFNSNQSISDLSRLLRKSQQFMINLYKFELEQLMKNDGLVSLFDGKILALKEGAYDLNFGLNINADSSFEVNMF